MADTTKIEWTDATWNPVTGCTLVSEGCRNCYAAELAAGRLKNHPSRKGLATRNADGAAKFTGEVRLNENWIDQPLRWQKPRRVFVCAHGDLFHEGVPDAWIDRVFAVMALAPQHTFQVLTKRPERMRAYLRSAPITKLQKAWGWRHTRTHNMLAAFKDGSLFERMPPLISPMPWPLPNVWLGTSVEDQDTDIDRIPFLIDTPAAVRFVSCEPLLGPVDLTAWRWRGKPPIDALDWIIVGGESGPRARPMDEAWARDLRDQCKAAGTAFFMKQMARKAPIPDDLMIREMPRAR